MSGTEDARAAVRRCLDYAGTEGLTDTEIVEGSNLLAGLNGGQPLTSEVVVKARQQLVAEGDVVDAGRTRRITHEREERVWMLAHYEEEETAA